MDEPPEPPSAPLDLATSNAQPWLVLQRNMEGWAVGKA